MGHDWQHGAGMTDRVLTVEELAATLPTNSQNGLLFDATGRLVVNTVAAPDVWTNGLPLTDSGALCVTIENVVVATATPIVERYEDQLYD